MAQVYMVQPRMTDQACCGLFDMESGTVNTQFTMKLSFTYLIDIAF